MTDAKGARLLLDRWGLPFDDVDAAALERVGTPEGLWAAGKLVAYQRQSEPFVHLDHDLFLLQALPELTAPVTFQNVERFGDQHGHYRSAIAQAEAACPVLPPRWGAASYALNCGLVAARDLAFVERWTTEALSWARDPANRGFFRRVLRGRDPGSLSCLLEQYLAACCVEASAGPRAGVLLAGAWEEAQRQATRAGYVHLLGDAKRDPEAQRRVARRLRMEFPDWHRHVFRVASAGP